MYSKSFPFYQLIPRIIPLLLLGLCTLSARGPLYAQPFVSVAERTLERNFLDYFLSNRDKDFYLSEDGSVLFLTTDREYQLIDAAAGTTLASGKHLPKYNAALGSLMGLLRNNSLNREDALERIRFEEGTEYLVLPEEELIIVLDWNKDRNVVKAVDLSTGGLLWETDRYRYASKSRSEFVDLVLGAAGSAWSGRRSQHDIAVSTARLQGYGDQNSSNEASPAAYGFLTPMDGTGKILLRMGDAYAALDLRTGEEQWVYDQRKLTIGFAGMCSDGGLVVVNFNASYLQKNDRLVLKLDTETGQEVWATEHLADFRAGRTYLVGGDRLVCDYYGAEVFDLDTGERLLLSIDERTVRSQNTVTTLFMSNSDGSRGTESIASPSVVEGDRLFTSTFKLGNRVYANDGSSKARIQCYDLESGAKRWESEKLDKGTDLSYANQAAVFVRKGKAFGKSTLFILDAGTGELLLETDNVDGSVYGGSPSDLLSDDFLFRAGKKSIYAFSTTDWSLAFTLDRKELGVGQVKTLALAGGRAIAVGEKGVAFLEQSGARPQLIPVAGVESACWDQDYLFVSTDRQTIALSIAAREPAGSIPFAPAAGHALLFSEDGSRLAIVRDQNHLAFYRNE